MIKINIFGDFVARNPDNIRIDAGLCEIINQVDINVCNFEAPIEGVGNHQIKSGPVLCQSKNSPKWLESKGFNLVLLANNHSMDYGEAGCRATANAFVKAETIGIGESHDAYAIKTIIIDNRNIAFLSLCQYEFGTVKSDNDNKKYGVAWVNDSSVRSIIEKASTENDYLFVLPHAGFEDIIAPLPEWRSIYKNFIEWGADAVIASHPHVPQGWEYYNGKPIFYSLGNFYFDVLDGGSLWYKSIGVTISINDEEILYDIHKLCFGKNSLGVDNSELATSHIAEVCNILTDEETYLTYINKIAAENYTGYRYGLLRGLCGFSFRDKFYYQLRLFALMMLNNSQEATLLNSIRCESHRWMILRYLENKLKV